MSDHADTIRRYLLWEEALSVYDETKHRQLVTGGEPRPTLDEAMTAFSEFVAERQQAIDERDAARRDKQGLSRICDKWERQYVSLRNERNDALTKRYEAEARCERAIDALRVYADPRNWSVSRDDLNHRVVAWIGPGAEKAGMPDALETARAALVSLGETE